MTRDLSKDQFLKALHENHWEPQGFMGYVRLNVPGHVCVSILNAGSRRRDQLAYLAQQQAEREVVV